MQPTIEQYNTTLQPYRNINIRIEVLDFNLDLIDEISGLATQADISIDADSDIRRTANISMILKSDYTRTASLGAGLQTNDMYWTMGNTYWFDKYIKIYVAIQDTMSQEYVWVKQGVYMLNSPSVSYDASNNQLSFEAVDMMAKITGMRNGYLEGITYNIPAGSNIVESMRSILLECGFNKMILYEPPEQLTPYDISIDIGSTVYDLLTELRDININWEIFFDEEGTFIFQSIPSGNVENPNTNETIMLSPLVTPTVWDRIQSSYDLSTDFEEVKNYIEVLGKTHEPDTVATDVTVDNNVLNCHINYDLYDSENTPLQTVRIVQIGVEITDLEAPPTQLETFINTINLIDKSNKNWTIQLNNDTIKYSNTYYVVRVGSDTINEQLVEYHEFLGDIQSFGVAWENNPDSPFYVGKYSYNGTTGICSYRDTVYYNPSYLALEYIANSNFKGQWDVIFQSVVSSTDENALSLDISQYWQQDSWNSLPNNSEYLVMFKTPILSKSYTRLLVAIAPNNILQWENLGYISVSTEGVVSTYNTCIDLSNQLYILRIYKDSLGDIKLYLSYTFIESSQVNQNYSTDVFNPPTFTNQIRYVCVGDEYDNIYSNDLCVQRAKYEIYLKARLHDSINITAVPIYWLGVNEIIQYNILNETDINNKVIPSYWLVKSLNTSLSTDGTQTINAIRYYPLYPSV